MSFEVIKKDPASRARTGVLHTAHGDVLTPVFLPIGTKATVKTVRGDELKEWGAQMVLANTYHLWMQPGDELIAKHGGLHGFMNWTSPVFTDSGGFQIFSLGERAQQRADTDGNQNPFNTKVEEEGVSFQSGSNGDKKQLTPELSVRIQANLGSDVALVLDEFPGYPFEYDRTNNAIERTTRWAARAKEEFKKIKNQSINPGQLQFGIIQGANFPDLREKSAKEIRALDFDGYAIGGVAVGEPAEEMYKAIDACVPFLEENKYRHLLGVGTPENIIQAAARGCDSFDCVIPTREARHGKIYIAHGEGYKTLNISKPEYKEDASALDETCGCYACKNHTKAYLNHLYKSGEILALRLLTEHNLRFYLNLMQKIRNSISEGTFETMIKSYKDLSL